MIFGDITIHELCFHIPLLQDTSLLYNRSFCCTSTTVRHTGVWVFPCVFPKFTLYLILSTLMNRTQFLRMFTQCHSKWILRRFYKLADILKEGLNFQSSSRRKDTRPLISWPKINTGKQLRYDKVNTSQLGSIVLNTRLEAIIRVMI